MPSNILLPANLSSAVDIERTSQLSNEHSTSAKNKTDKTEFSSEVEQTMGVSAQEGLLKKYLETEEVKTKNDTEAQLEQAIAVVSEFMNQPPRNINFTRDSDSGKTVIKVFDIESQELIKQFPSEELISIAQKIQALHQEVGEKAGILLDKTV